MDLSEKAGPSDAPGAKGNGRNHFLSLGTPVERRTAASATRGVRWTTRGARARNRCGGRADDAGELAIPEHRVARDLKRPRGAIGRGLLLYRQRFPPSRCLGASRRRCCRPAKVIRKPRLLSDNASSYISGDPVDWLEEHLSSRTRFIPAASPRVWRLLWRTGVGLRLSGVGLPLAS